MNEALAVGVISILSVLGLYILLFEVLEVELEICGIKIVSWRKR